MAAGDFAGSAATQNSCACGRPLPQQPSGRPRRSCSPACKLRRDRTLRKVERRRAWRALWLTGGSTRQQIATEVRQLEDDIRELLETLTDGAGSSRQRVAHDAARGS
jgi:hypothetical protein